MKRKINNKIFFSQNLLENFSEFPNKKTKNLLNKVNIYFELNLSSKYEHKSPCKLSKSNLLPAKSKKLSYISSSISKKRKKDNNYLDLSHHSYDSIHTCDLENIPYTQENLSFSNLKNSSNIFTQETFEKYSQFTEYSYNDCLKADKNSEFSKSQKFINYNIKKIQDSSNKNNIFNSEKIKENIILNFPKLKDFEKDYSEISKFGLLHKNFFDNLPEKEITHDLLPIELKNDDEYKKRLLNFIQLPFVKKNKTDFQKFNKKKKFSEYFNEKIISYNNPRVEDEFRMCTSLNKNFDRFFSLENQENNCDIFKIYKDHEIGITKLWQKDIIYVIQILLFKIYFLLFFLS